MEVTMQKRALIFMAVATILISPSWGHHSHANYDMTEYTHITGKVNDILWINPHIWIFMEVTNEDGHSVQWALEAATPAQIARNGVTRETVKLGDTITARCHQMHDDSSGCLLGYITGEDGVERLWD
tara:strand:+ start:2101 stop:2481 length:381 start_codon:yes stop_codon:yes gene_type:complete